MDTVSTLGPHSETKQRIQYSATTWQVWRHHYRTRKQLHRLLLTDAEHLQRDLGLSSEEALIEIQKPFWRR